MHMPIDTAHMKRTDVYISHACYLHATLSTHTHTHAQSLITKLEVLPAPYSAAVQPTNSPLLLLPALLWVLLLILPLFLLLC